MPKKGNQQDWASWEEMPPEEFRGRAEKAKQMAAAFVAGIEELFPGLVTLTKDQRRSAPRLRDGEHAMLGRVLDAVDLKPALFESLADVDEGMDPNQFETGLLRDRIEKHRVLRELSGVLAPLGGELADSELYLAAKFRDAVYAAYRLAKAHAETDRKINDVLAPVIDFMRQNAVAGAAKRAAKAAGGK